jgi:hypothetical protein
MECDKIMINRDANPGFLNSFLDYSITILNKSPNSVKEYLTSFKSKCQEVLLLVFKNADLTCHLRGIKLSKN